MTEPVEVPQPPVAPVNEGSETPTPPVAVLETDVVDDAKAVLADLGHTGQDVEELLGRLWTSGLALIRVSQGTVTSKSPDAAGK